MAATTRTEPLEPLVTAREAAATCRVSLDTLYRLVGRGALPAIRLTEHGPLRFKRTDLERLIETRRATRSSGPVDSRGVVRRERARAAVRAGHPQ